MSPRGGVLRYERRATAKEVFRYSHVAAHAVCVNISPLACRAQRERRESTCCAVEVWWGGGGERAAGYATRVDAGRPEAGSWEAVAREVATVTLSCYEITPITLLRRQQRALSPA